MLRTPFDLSPFRLMCYCITAKFPRIMNSTTKNLPVDNINEINLTSSRRICSVPLMFPWIKFRLVISLHNCAGNIGTTITQIKRKTEKLFWMSLVRSVIQNFSFVPNMFSRWFQLSALRRKSVASVTLRQSVVRCDTVVSVIVWTVANCQEHIQRSDIKRMFLFVSVECFYS